MSQHDREEAVKIGIGLSTQFIGAALGLLTLVGGVITFLLSNREFDRLSAITLLACAVCLLASICFGFLGIALARNNGNEGWWEVNVSRRNFNIQTALGAFGIIFFLTSVLAVSMQQQKKTSEQDGKRRNQEIVGNGISDPGRTLPDSLLLVLLSDKTERRLAIDSIHQQQQLLARRISVLESELKNVGGPSGKRSGWTVFFSFLLIISGIGLFVFALAPNWREHTAVAITATLCSSLITFSGVKLYGLEKFEGDIRFFERNNFGWSEGDSIKRANQIIAFDSIGSIGGFREGQHDTGFDARQVDEIEGEIRRKEVSVLFIVGEVDKRELINEAHRTYGSNITLARARAEFVKGRLLPFCRKRGIRIMTMNRGAFHSINVSDPVGLSSDRRVTVYGFFMR